jgi:hypothetical protein
LLRPTQPNATQPEPALQGVLLRLQEEKIQISAPDMSINSLSRQVSRQQASADCKIRC